MARILGLDLGSHSLKAVYLDSAQRAQPVQRYVEVLRPLEGDRVESLKAALRQLSAEFPPGELDQTVVALPGPALATHPITLPFSDAKRIESALPFEIEAQLPFDLSEAVFDYQVTSRVEGKSDLLVAVIRQDELRTLLATLLSLGIDPRIVTHPALAYQNLLSNSARTLGYTEGPVAILDVGHERTSVAIGMAGADLEFARTFSGGGKDLSRALASELQISFEQASHWKETQGAVASAVAVDGGDGERIAGALVRGLQPILRELRPTLKSYTARSRKAVGRIYLCGGTARLPGLPEQLTRDLGIPVELLTLPNDALDVIPAGSAASAAQAYCLALRGQATGLKAPRFNLRRGQFAFKGHFDFVRERVGQLIAFTAVLIALSIGYSVVRNSLLARREADVDQRLCDVTQRVLGRCEKNFDRAIALLEGSASASASVPKFSAVNLLAEMTQRVPEDVKVTFDQIRIESDRVALKGVTGSSKDIDKLTQSLKKFRCFKDIQEGKVEKTKDNKGVAFTLDVSVDCPEQPAATSGS